MPNKKRRNRERTWLACIVALFIATVSAQAVTLTVNSASDDGNGTCTANKCTLRDAVLSAHSGDTITFALPASSAVVLTNGTLSVSTNLVISGPGAALLTVTRSTAAGTPDFRIFDIASGTGDLTINGLTITNGLEPTNAGGGAIHNAGRVSLSHCVLSGNVAKIAGGGIANTGIAVIDSSTIAGNSATLSGGIYNRGSGDLTITNSTISGNTTTDAGTGAGAGGGIMNLDTAKLTINNSTISGNTATGAGGIYNASSVAVTIATSTISNNTSRNGEGGGGIINLSAGTIKPRSTIVAKNIATSGPDIDGAGPITSQGYNLIGSNDQANITPATGDQIGTAAAPIDPLLGPLQDNGGPTWTQALLSNSKAIDKGDSGGSVADQRGFTRPVDSPTITNAGDGTDVGAYEVQADQVAGCSEINLVVNNNADAGAGSLRSIIAAACPGSTITFAAGVRGTISLTSGELLLNKNLTIRGPGANLLAVQRSTAAGTPAFRIFHINGNFNDAISGLTITNGLAPGALGGGIDNDNGTLTLDGVTVSGNTADVGAGIYTARAATISNSTISGNIVSGNIAGDGGGAVYNTGGTLTLTNSTLSGNVAQNSSGAAQGGAIRNNLGTVTITSSTIAGNSADQGGGIYTNNGGSVTLRNTLIAQNTSPNGPDINGTVNSNGYNLIGNTTGGTFSSFPAIDQVGTAGSPINPLLGPLQDNGGPTFTRALLTGSPAIDKGIASGTSKDQRGFKRPSDVTGIANASGGDGSDIGAFELQAPTLANLSTRLRVETGDNVLIGGFIVTGTQLKKVIILAIGPSLTSLGVPGALANPTLELYSGSTLLQSNDDWVNSPDKQAIIDSGVAPSNNLESAIIATLPANNSGYTAIVRGVNNGTGIGVVQAYDLDRSVDSKMANISTRGLVQTGDNILIAGTIILGETSQRVIVRGIGPSLGIPGQLADPTLELRDQNGGLVDSNDNWKDSPNKQAIIDSTIPPGNDLESAIVATLPANGAQYTAIVRGANNGTGIGVVEVYALP